MLILALFACQPDEPEKSPVVEDTAPEGTDADEDGWTLEEGDCDDADEYSNPDAPDVPYDGVDQDCDGADLNDYDGDGYVGVNGGGDDCNDSNATAHPGGTEVCYNLVDEDCNGDPDDDYDCDNDGFDLTSDCDDEDPAINPDAEEVWYDGVDADCDSADDFDRDGDGEQSDQYDGPDCDDEDARRTSEGVERWDGVDEDCSGPVDDIRSWDSTSTWHGDAAIEEAGFGTSIASVPDASGDGVRDLLVGVPGAYGEDAVFGRVYLVPWGEGLQIPASTALATIEGAAGEQLGASMLVLDDGALVLGGPGEGAAYVFDGVSSGEALTTADARLVLSFDAAGGDLAAWGELVAVATAYVANSGTSVHLFDAGASGSLTADDAVWSWSGDGDTLDLANVGDADGDGLDELVVATTGFSDVPRAVVAAGSAIADGVTDLPVLSGFTGAPVFVGADLDGDGLVETLAADTEAADGAGVVYVLRGVAEGTLNEIAIATVTGDVANGRLRAAPGLADLDGDGADDVLVCATGDGESSVDARCGLVAAAALAAGGALTPDLDGFSVTSDDADDFFGSVTLLDDVDADGDTDLWVGAPAGEGTVTFFEHE